MCLEQDTFYTRLAPVWGLTCHGLVSCPGGVIDSHPLITTEFGDKGRPYEPLLPPPPPPPTCSGSGKDLAFSLFWSTILMLFERLLFILKYLKSQPLNHALLKSPQGTPEMLLHCILLCILFLLAECEVRTAIHGSAGAMKTRKEKASIHNFPYGPSKRG